MGLSGVVPNIDIPLIEYSHNQKKNLKKDENRFPRNVSNERWNHFFIYCHLMYNRNNNHGNARSD